MYYQVERYWMVRLVCIAILIIIFAVMALCNNATNSIYEVNETSCVITYIDRIGITLWEKTI